VASVAAYELLAIGVVLVALVMLVGFYFLHGLRMRRLKALRGEASDPRAQSDRAYNRIALARREADLLASQGGDVDRARELVNLANRQLDARSYGQAYDLAQAAHETLVTGRRGPLRSGRTAADPAPTARAPPPGSAASTSPGSGSTPASPAPSPVPKNRAEAQFELRLFEEELARASHGATPPAEAKEMFVQAHAAYDRADYAGAFRLSLRGRRRLGASIESLGPPKRTSLATSESDAVVDPAQAAEEVALQERCPDCGHPTVSGDAFCRGCGSARTPSTCPSCGAPRTPTDAFCGKCGMRYAVATPPT
jgi:hypothetical protein